MLRLWPGLIRFLDDPRIPLDNNPVERQLRGPVVGRKNHLGSRSVRGIRVTEVLYTLAHSAMLAGIDPRTYLLAAAQRALDEPGAVLLPHEMLTRDP
jgi:transposase